MTETALPPTWTLTTIGEHLTRSDERVDPNSLFSGTAGYIGLENIESGTGRLLNMGRVEDAKSTKSCRPKKRTADGTFARNDWKA